MDKPVFQSAIPKRRYQIGEFSAVVLGDIESEGNKQYTYIMAIVKEGATVPTLYVTLENNALEIIGEGINENLGTNTKWQQLDQFIASAMNVVVEMLGLRDEMPVLLS